MPQLTPELAFVTTATNGVVAAPLHFSWGYFMHPVRLSVALLSISVALYGCTTQESNPTGNTTEADASTPDPTDSTDSNDATDAADPTDSTDTSDSSDASDTTDASDTSDATDTSDPSTTEPDPECTDGDTQNGTTACGLNNEGVFVQTCENGSWMDTDTCTGTDICQNGTTQAGSETCGLNNEGTFEELCADGAWAQTETCSGTDVCANGTLDYQLASCAGGATGAKTLECVSGTWTEETVCPEAGNTSYSAMGRTITFDSVNMNGSGNRVAQVQPGTSTSLQVGGWVVNNQTSCPGCITQFYVRLNGIMNLCLGSSTGNWSFNESTTFTAPTEPGIYYVNSTETWDYSCLNSTGVSTEYNSRTVAMLVVSGPDGTDNGDNGNGDDNTGGTCDTSGLTAGTGTVQVQAFNDTVISWATAQNETFTFPAESEHFVSATMHMTLECPDGGCDPWDRYGSVSLNHSSGENHEIARFITPYAIDASSGYPGSCAWSYDVTPFTHLLRGQQELSLFISTWIGGDRGWKVTVTFDFERGIPDLEP
ncbi:MAG: hypothetical protein HOI23_14575, partial [Deltaproteobacteria bacterium]|nr:hypothetical protein [Deltaproteobacteria bacterium]